jgi:RND family efflux transporter MFP subunit
LAASFENQRRSIVNSLFSRSGTLRLVALGGILSAAGIALLGKPTTTSSTAAAQSAPVETRSTSTNGFEVAGNTQCILTKVFTIAPVPLHPVSEVLVEPGSRVKKGQLLVKIDDDEPQADVRAKQAALENAQVGLQEARRFLDQSEKAYNRGALPEQIYHQARVGAIKSELDERAAKATLDAAKAELEHYRVTSEIDGVVSWLKVNPGMVSRPGTSVWGEVLDLRELDARCELTFEQIDQVAVGQVAEVRRKNKKEWTGSGRIVYVGIAADAKTGLVPVHVRFANPDERLRCGEPVDVRFLLR